MPAKSPKPTTTKVPKKKSIPLIVETHPVEYTGFAFITLLQYRKQPMLAIIDNADDRNVKAFVIDLCGPEGVDEELLISVAAHWYEHNRSGYPISIEFSKQGMTHEMSRIYRTLSKEFITRAIGPIPSYPMSGIVSIKRRRRKAISPAVEIHAAGSVTSYDFEQGL